MTGFERFQRLAEELRNPAHAQEILEYRRNRQEENDRGGPTALHGGRTDRGGGQVVIPSLTRRVAET